jgi:hypothetical protein
MVNGFSVSMFPILSDLVRGSIRLQMDPIVCVTEAPPFCHP